ncbi:MAG: hypothetical protein WC162_11985 [Sphaerochaetaceae bacterium]
MKKTLVILVILALTVFAVMAEESSVTLNSTVAEEVDFVFLLAEAETNPSTYNAAAAGTADFKITSTKVVNFRGEDVSVIIDVSVTPWTGTNNHGTNALILGTLNAAATSGNLKILVDNSIDRYTVNFGHGHKKAFDVGTFSVSWLAASELAADNYTATVIIAYSQV